MKKIILTVIMMSALSTVCFAQLMKTPPKYAAPRAVAAKKVVAPAPAVPAPMVSSEVMGKVVSVSMADAAKGTLSNIVIIDDMGKKATLAILPSTVILKGGKAITADKVMKDESVRVKYMEKQGSKAALSIQVVG